MTATALAAAVDGVIVGNPDATATSFAIDSRDLDAGACFVALRGERDGHDFAADAFARGATVALVAREVDHPAGTALVVVEDPLAALARAARRARDAWTDVTVVGITGSVGKTSTKDLTAAALGGARRVHASRASFNNEAGLPLTLLHAPDGTEVVIAEMGARFPGNIADLCAVARPTVGVVTRIGLAHAEHLGGRDGILKTKGELVESLPPGGTAVLNADDARVAAMATLTDAAVLTFGQDGGDVRAEHVTLDEHLHPRFHLRTPWGDTEVHLAIAGRHQVVNALGAAAAALAVGVPVERIAEGLGGARLSAMRMDLVTADAGYRVLDDSYNASPTSMAAALRAIDELPAERRFAVLGTMLELGPDEAELHREAGVLADELGIHVISVAQPWYGVEGPDAVPDTDAALARLRDLGLGDGDVVLVKASRGAGLDRVAKALMGA